MGPEVLECGVELVVERRAEGQRAQLAQLAACVQLGGEATHAVRSQLDEETTTRLAPPRVRRCVAAAAARRRVGPAPLVAAAGGALGLGGGVREEA